jgi:hypothetical protein
VIHLRTLAARLGDLPLEAARAELAAQLPGVSFDVAWLDDAQTIVWAQVPAGTHPPVHWRRIRGDPGALRAQLAAGATWPEAAAAIGLGTADARHLGRTMGIGPGGPGGRPRRSLVLVLDRELEQRCRAAARAAGLDLDAWALAALDRAAR